MKESDLSFYFAKHTFKSRFQTFARWRCFVLARDPLAPPAAWWIFLKVWSLIHCIANKIKKIKQIEIGSPQLADNLNDLNRISDELSDSLGWIEAELPGRTAINKQTNSFKQKLNYWMRIMNEFKLLRSAKIRQKELKKSKSCSVLVSGPKWPIRKWPVNNDQSKIFNLSIWRFDSFRKNQTRSMRENRPGISRIECNSMSRDQHGIIFAKIKRNWKFFQ